MASNLLESLVATVGVRAVAERALGQKKFDIDAEEFFLRHYDELGWRNLMDWLAHERPDEAARARPVAAVVARIRDTFCDPHDVLALVDLPDMVRRVADGDVRDEVIEAFRTKLDADHWIRLALLASGGEAFSAIRNLERRLIDRQQDFPPGLVENGPFPLLTPTLFGGRRDDAACIGALRDALRDERNRLYALWAVQQAALLTRIGEPDVVLGHVPAFCEIERAATLRNRFLLDLALQWPDVEQRNTWIIRRILKAATERRLSWSHLWWETPPELRDAVAIASLETANPAPWAARAIVRDMYGRNAINRLFELMHRPSPSSRWLEDFNDGLQTSMLALGREPTSDEVDEAFKDMSPDGRAAWIQQLKLPEGADEETESRWVDLMLGCGLRPDVLISRLRELPLTSERARRIAGIALDAGLFWTLDDRAELARAAGTLEHVPMPHWFDETSVAAFRVLAGAGADEALGVRLDDRIGKGALHPALSLAKAARELVTGPRREHLRRLILRLPIGRLADMQEHDPWLIDRSDVVAEASRPDRDDWGLVDRLPDYLDAAARAKALQTPGVPLAEALLDRVEALGSARRDVLSIALVRLRNLGPGSLGTVWLARKLDTRSLWDEPGREIVGVLLGVADKPGADAVLNICLEAAMRQRFRESGGDGGLGHAMHTTVGSVLVAITTAAVEAGDPGIARRALAALVHLNPASRLRGSIRALRKLSPGDDVLALIETNEALLRRSGAGDAATVDAIRDALSVLVFGEQAEERR